VRRLVQPTLIDTVVVSRFVDEPVRTDPDTEEISATVDHLPQGRHALV